MLLGAVNVSFLNAIHPHDPTNERGIHSSRVPLLIGQPTETTSYPPLRVMVVSAGDSKNWYCSFYATLTCEPAN
jgi:hypothetical protein